VVVALFDRLSPSPAIPEFVWQRIAYPLMVIQAIEIACHLRNVSLDSGWLALGQARWLAAIPSPMCFARVW
jgi:hypothetical protein